MPTLRETIQADIAKREASLTAKKEKLAELEASFSDALGRDVDELRMFLQFVGGYVFNSVQAAAQAAGQQNQNAAGALTAG